MIPVKFDYDWTLVVSEEVIKMWLIDWFNDYCLTSNDQ
jgi:hypothetical protein